MSRSDRRVEKIKDVLRRRQPDLTVVLENIHDPHNVSAILRTCDAVGVHHVELVYSSEPFPAIGRKSSSSAAKWVDRRKHRSIDECYGTLRAEGFVILATSLGAESRLLYEVDLTRKIALVFGNEHRGVSVDAAERADELIRVPMRGMIESLNVSVACGVTLFEALRQRMACREEDRVSLSKDEFEDALQDWIRR
jgi:tRNA (guanosine-2'-O-)-methyltransferase